MQMHRYGAARPLVALAARVWRPVDRNALWVELLRVVGDTIHSARAIVWIPGVR